MESIEHFDCNQKCDDCRLSCMTLDAPHSAMTEEEKMLFRVMYVKATGELLLNLSLTPITIDQIIDNMVPGIGTIIATKNPLQIFVSTQILILMRPPTEIYDSIRKLESMAKTMASEEEEKTPHLIHETQQGTLH